MIYPAIQAGADVESRPRSEVISRAEAGPEVSTVHSWNCPPEVDGARYAIILPSGEKVGDATSWPPTRVAGDPTDSVAGSKLTTSRSANRFDPFAQTMAISFSSGDTAGCMQPSSGGVSAWPGVPARPWNQIWEWTW